MQPNLTDNTQMEMVLRDLNPQTRNAIWLQSMERFLEYVQTADLETRKTKDFHYQLWEQNAISGVGMGTVDISAAIDDAEFRTWLAEESLKPLPEGSDARLAHFQSLFKELTARLRRFSKRTPWVKMFRTLAALYPWYFTTIVDRRAALECHRAFFGNRKKPDPISRQVELMSRLEEILGPVSDDYRSIAERMTLPWYVYEDVIESNSTEAVTETSSPSGEAELKPLPAAQRRKGLTSIAGGVATLASALRFTEEGVSRDELMDFLRVEFPENRDSSLRTLINVFRNEFHLIQEVDGKFIPTARGELYLETNDPEELIPIFLTRILGVDHVLSALAQNDLTTKDLIVLLKSVNPGWTSDFAPSAMLKWLRDFELIQSDSGSFQLTELGKSWSQYISWQPEFLKPANPVEHIEPGPSASVLEIGIVNFKAIVSQTISKTAFSEHLVGQLHFGLWAHSRRHFAILAGLSGSGKTMLAQRYAEALAAQYTDKPSANIFIQAVQPGWYDPASLFGYLNPLMPDSYVRSPLLDFLLRATHEPTQPFTVILDEMNLSHPEQYFAPVLSAMESGDSIRLHNEGDVFDGIPSTMPYPSNVAFIGTVNMDETTHGISDKVLDRAFTIEFWDINLVDFPNWHNYKLSPDDLAAARSCLEALLKVLSSERLHFGWRTVDDVLSYLAIASQSDSYNFRVSLDDVVYARLLPKLRGSESNRLHDALEKTIDVLQQNNLVRSCSKVRQLKLDLTDTGIMRFWR